jgi:hypothetical protein
VNGVIRRTTNGGANWSALTSGTTNNLYEIHYGNNGYIYTVGESGTIRRSTNNGSNWNGMPSGTSNLLYDVRFPSSPDFNTIFAIGSGGIILKTTNGGTNWNALTSGTTNDLHEVHFTTGNIGYAVGNNGTIRATTNSGQTWAGQTSNTTNNLWSVFFPDFSIGFTVGENGTIRKTVTGVLGIDPVNNTIPDNFSLGQNYPNPFNPITVISFQVADNSFVSLTIYDILGKEIEVMVNEQLKAGVYEVQWNAADYPSGVYLYTINAGSFRDTKKMILTK